MLPKLQTLLLNLFLGLGKMSRLYELLKVIFIESFEGVLKVLRCLISQLLFLFCLHLSLSQLLSCLALCWLHFNLRSLLRVLNLCNSEFIILHCYICILFLWKSLFISSSDFCFLSNLLFPQDVIESNIVVLLLPTRFFGVLITQLPKGFALLEEISFSLSIEANHLHWVWIFLITSIDAFAMTPL